MSILTCAQSWKKDYECITILVQNHVQFLHVMFEVTSTHDWLGQMFEIVYISSVLTLGIKFRISFIIQCLSSSMFNFLSSLVWYNA